MGLLRLAEVHKMFIMQAAVLFFYCGLFHFRIALNALALF